MTILLKTASFQQLAMAHVLCPKISRKNHTLFYVSRIKKQTVFVYVEICVHLTKLIVRNDIQQIPKRTHFWMTRRTCVNKYSQSAWNTIDFLHYLFVSMMFFIGCVILKSSNTESIGKLPCGFYDTIYITDGKTIQT